jgi:hypothetical protein
VPSQALAVIPDGVLDEWRAREEQIAEMTREIEAARSALALQASVDAATAARRDLRAALDEAMNVGAAARAELQVARLGPVEARIGLDLARLEERHARDAVRAARDLRGRRAVREARAGLAEAREDRVDASWELAAARVDATRAERTAGHDLAVADEAIGSARRALNEVGAVVRGVRGRRITAGEIRLLEARRDVALAELAHEQARVAIAGGARIRIRPFLDQLDEARAAERFAREALLGSTTALR